VYKNWFDWSHGFSNECNNIWGTMWMKYGVLSRQSSRDSNLTCSVDLTGREEKHNIQTESTLTKEHRL
jgi:hypothetical protein